MKSVLDLYELLPAVYRLEDARRGEPLKALLAVVSEQAGILKRSVDGLWDDFFIETCERWVIPYIGALVANNPLHDTDSRKPDTATGLFDDLRGPDLRPPFALRLRPDVAKTIYYRRRKGTVPMLEELARDVTGWGAHVVEFFELLEWSQHLSHLRLYSHEANELRRIEAADRADGPFDRMGHTADVRRIQPQEGRYNIKNVGFFLWRLGSFPLQDVPARRLDPPAPSWQYHFSPLGNPAPLFTCWRREGDEAGLATELHVPGPIRPAFLFDDLDRYRNLTPPPTRPPVTDLYGPVKDERSFLVTRNGAVVAPAQDPNAPPNVFQPQIVCMRLDPWPAVQPVGRLIAVDPARGRLAVGDGWGGPTNTLDVAYHYGFSAELGGGPYDRRKWLVRHDPDTVPVRFRVKEDGIVPAGEPPATHTSVEDALIDWQLHPEQNTVIEILDSRTYPLPPSIQLRNGHGLVLEAATGQRPLLQTKTLAAGFDVQVVPAPAAGDRREAALTLSGVVVEGFLHVSGDLGRLRLLHSTLVPGRRLNPLDGRPLGQDPSLIAEAAAGPDPINLELRVEIAFSVTGPLRLPRDARGLWLLDSIVDGTRKGTPPVQGTALAATGTNDQPGPPTVLERTTILGPSWLKKLTLGTEVIFTHPVIVTQRQEGCVRFSYVPPGSATPRRYRCQPDLAVETAIEKAEREAVGPLSPAQKNAIRQAVQARVVPDFTDLYYGLPGYAQLRLGVPSEIRKGAEDGSEMGAFSHLKQPQRETNLRIRLDEYLPFGLEPGLIYVT